MKTLFFCNLIPDKFGSYEWLLVTLGGLFRQGGDELVLALAGEPLDTVAEALRREGVRWEIVEGWSEGEGREHAWNFCLPAFRLLRRERPDVAVVHFGNELPSLVVAVLGKLGFCPRTRWVWQQDQQIQDPSRLSARVSKLRALTLAFSRFVAVYDGGRRSMLKRGIPDRRIAVIYNALKDHRPAREKGWLRTELGLPRETLLLVSTGWLIPRKRIGSVLDTFSRVLAQTDRDVRLLLIGEGPERERLEAQARELGVSEKTVFLGLRNDVREILHEASLLVHCSLAETCTYAISESMASGIPAVVTEAGAAREQIETGVSGHVVERDDLEGMASHIASLLNDDAQRAAFGQAARHRWEGRYRVEVSAGKYYALYRSLAGLGDRL